MGSITIQVTGDASVGTLSKTFTVSNANIGRLVAWAQAQFDTGTPLTPPQALARWAERMIGHTQQDLMRRERETSAVPPFDAA